MTTGAGDRERVNALWDADAPGILRLPSGRLVRGRGLRHPLPDGVAPTLGIYLLGKPPPAVEWESRWVRWPDFRLPSSPEVLREALGEALAAAPHGRVEFACLGGKGRTGTALACLAVLDGVPAAEAVAFVRTAYDRHAVETPWQKRFVARFAD
ncbi:protein-tyrosine-phosphatase [Virgisporangium aliadipatigenens]|uniref:Protein-tyrosine-phosphatase n=1 Tax=Virgisporangium aliadipatigenens TaxID=741659 RepID=A0A8J4DS87_9ACTN|nr:protein phosphatase [Virgisporangium aliadipatigenens]GIJ48955.1 protein-tyrosine-phosphatase [Virgisporangium aliadipatigenens]